MKDFFPTFYDRGLIGFEDLFKTFNSFAETSNLALKSFPPFNIKKIDEDNYEVIIDSIMVLIIPFISRLIDNEERNSYAASIKAVESNILNQSKGGLFH